MKLGSDVLWLSENDVQALLTMPETIAAVEEAFGLHGIGSVQLPAKVYLDFKPFEGDLRAMPCYVGGAKPMAGVKIVNSHWRNPERGLPAVAGIMVFVDPETGMPLAILGAGTLTGMRTGAAGGIAAKYMARRDSKTIGLIGCGRQAVTQAQALQLLFKIDRALVWGKTKQESDAFCAANKKELQMELAPVAEVKDACQADILVTTTPVRTPVVKAEWVRPGTHINAIGADAPGKQELETALIKKARVVVDEWHQASHAGEINVPVTAGVYGEKDIVGQLGEVVIGKKKARASDADITVFDSTGLALQDVAVARIIYDKALQQSKGQVLKLHG